MAKFLPVQSGDREQADIVVLAMFLTRSEYDR